MGPALIALAWIIGLSGTYQAFMSVMFAVAVFGGDRVVTPYEQGHAIGQVVGAILILLLALWLRRKGLAKIRKATQDKSTSSA